MNISPPKQSIIKHKTLNELITLLQSPTVASSEGDLNQLKTAFYYKLHKSFYDLCHKVVSKLLSDMPDKDAYCADLFQETFLTAFEKIENFKVNPSWEEPECKKVLLSWMGKIATYKLFNGIKVEKEADDFLAFYTEYLDSENSPGSIGYNYYTPTYDMEKFKSVWEKLKPFPKEVILLSFKHDRLGEENKKHLPDEAIAYLTQKYNVKPAAIRKAKERTLTKIRHCKK